MLWKALKTVAKEKLRGNWGWGALTILLFGVASNIMLFAGYMLFTVALLLTLLILKPVNDDFYGILGIFILIIFPIFLFTMVYVLLFLLTGIQAATYDLVSGKKTDNVFAATFSQFIHHRGWRFFKTWLLSLVFNTLWSFLFLIPGWIKGLAYSQSLYIIQDAIDNGTSMTARKAITLSRKVMDGHKWELLGLMLSFVGWLFLSIITYGIGFFWTLPYMFTTMAEYHKYVMADYTRRHQNGLPSSKTYTTASYSVK
ncbi:DUF975 family protein [Ligilactobacillus sp. LYQ112]|uniref:DUF975 family protein n=1 Tax=Ligilactobacillus sp. LYQ112 TaxID=3391060 RepID=UPI0039830EAC